MGSDVWVKPSSGLCLRTCGASTNLCPTIDCALQRAKSNDTLILTAGYYSGEGNVGISGRNFTHLTGLSFEGEGLESTVISCLGSSTKQNWLKTSSNFVVKVSSLSIENCQGIIALNTSLTVEDVKFSNHTAVANGTGILSIGATGRTFLSITRCQFKGLVASAGSALTVIGPVSLMVTLTNFSHNGMKPGEIYPTATSGGAVWMTGLADGYFDECIFLRNGAQENGGAVTITVEGELGDFSSDTGLVTADGLEVDRRVVLFNRCSFEYNSIIAGETCPGSTDCDALGGAVYSETHGTTTFTTCHFTNNRVYASDLSGGRGGAIYATRGLNTAVQDAKIHITDCTFASNTVIASSSGTSMCVGGAIYANYLILLLMESTFTENAVYLDTNEDNQDIFSVNPFLGGAIGTLHVLLDIIGCTIEKNDAGMGGAGGGVWLETGTIANISSTTFYGNTVSTSYGASGQGGALASVGKVQVRIVGSHFIENRIMVCTSAKFGSEPSARLQRRDAQQCMSGSGGALYIQGASLLVEACTFMGNSADSGGHDSGATGGALCVVDSAAYDVSFYHCLFDGNRAGGGTSGVGSLGGASHAANGGAVFGLSSLLNFQYTKFVNNTALGSPSELSYGGAVTLRFYGQGYSTFNNCTFLTNRACPRYCPKQEVKYLQVFDQGGRGGALALISASAKVTNSYFELNKVYSSYGKAGLGGAAYLTSSGHLIASNTTFHLNTIVPHTNSDLQWVSSDQTTEADFKHLAVGSQIAATSFPDALVNVSLLDECIFTPRCFEAQGLAKPDDGSSTVASLIEIASEFFEHTVQCWDIAGLGAHVLIQDLSPKSNHTHLLLVAPLDISVEYSNNVNGGTGNIGVPSLEINSITPPGLSVWAWGGIIRILSRGHKASIEDIRLINTTLETDSDVSITGSFISSGSRFCASSDLISNCEVRHSSKWSPKPKSSKTSDSSSSSSPLFENSLDSDSIKSDCPVILANKFVELGMVETWVYVALLLDMLPSILLEVKDYYGVLKDYDIDASLNHDRTRLFLELATNSISSLFNSNGRTMVMESVGFVIQNNYESIADLGPGIIHGNKLNSPLRLKLEISCERIELTNAWFVVAEGSTVFSFPETLTFHMHDQQSLFLLEGSFWLEKYTSIENQLSSFDRCNPSSDDYVPPAQFSVNTSYNLFINGSAIQAPGSQFHIETLDRTHRIVPYIYVANTSQWEGSLNLQHAVPLGSVTLNPDNDDVTSLYQIVEFGELTRNKTNISVISLGEMKIGWQMDFTPDGIMGKASIDELTCDGILPYSSLLRDLKMADTIPSPSQMPILNCSSCRRNKKCDYCATSGEYSQSSYGCYTKGNGSCTSTQFKESCCANECGEHHKILGFISFPRGNCRQNKHHWYLHECHCNSIMFEGSSCDNINTSGIILIVFFCLIPVVLVFSSLAIYFKRVIADAEAFHQEELENQEANTLADLRQRLLNTGDDDEESKLRNVGVDKRKAAKQVFLQDLTEKLVLQDVLVPFEQLTLEKHIGEGGMGVVYLAKFRSARVALKLIKTPEFMEMDEQEMERFRAEAYLMSRLRHPNLVLIMGVTQFIADKHKIPASADGIMPGFKVGDKTIGIISEYLNRGSLDTVLYGDRAIRHDSQNESVNADQKFPVAGWSEDITGGEAETRKRALSIDSIDSYTVWSYEIILSCALQAARGVLFLHSQTPPIVHRDLKCSNLVIDDKFVVKITDFGMSRLLPHITEDRSDSIYSRPSSSGPSSSAYSSRQSAHHSETGQSAYDTGKDSIISSLHSTSSGYNTDNYSILPDLPIMNPVHLPQHNLYSRVEYQNNNPYPRPESQNNLYTRLDSDEKPMPSILPPTNNSIDVDDAPSPSLPFLPPEKRVYVEDGGGVTMTSNVGTVAWAAPEIFAGESVASYSLACDSYSFGMILYELAEKRAPFDHLNSRFDIMDLVLQGKRPEITCSLLLDEQPAYRALMERCWAQRPDMRPTFHEIVDTLEEMYAAERSANKQLEAEARRASSLSRRSITTSSNGRRSITSSTHGSSAHNSSAHGSSAHGRSSSSAIHNRGVYQPSPSMGSRSMIYSTEPTGSDFSDDKPKLSRFGFRLGLFPPKNSDQTESDQAHPRSRSSF